MTSKPTVTWLCGPECATDPPEHVGNTPCFLQSSRMVVAEVSLAVIIRATRAGLVTTLAPNREVSVGAFPRPR